MLQTSEWGQWGIGGLVNYCELSREVSGCWAEKGIGGSNTENEGATLNSDVARTYEIHS